MSRLRKSHVATACGQEEDIRPGKLHKTGEKERRDTQEQSLRIALVALGVLVMPLRG